MQLEILCQTDVTCDARLPVDSLWLCQFYRQYVDLIDLTIDYGEDTDVDDLPPPVFSHTQRFELYEYPPVVKNTSVF